MPTLLLWSYEPLHSHSFVEEELHVQAACFHESLGDDGIDAVTDVVENRHFPYPLPGASRQLAGFVHEGKDLRSAVKIAYVDKKCVVMVLCFGFEYILMHLQDVRIAYPTLKRDDAEATQVAFANLILHECDPW